MLTILRTVARPSRFHVLFSCALALLTVGAPAQLVELTYDSDGSAANGITDGTAGGWNTTATNQVWYQAGAGSFSAWSNDTEAVAVFGGGTAGTAGSLSVGTVTAAGLIFKTPFAGNYTLSGGSLTLAGAAPAVTVQANATITSALAGVAGLIKDGSAQLTLAGSLANTLSGTTQVLAGNLVLSKNSGVNALAGDVVIDGGTLIWNGDHQLPDSASVTLKSGGLQLNSRSETLASLSILGGNANANTSSNGGFLTLTDTLTVSGASSLGLNSGADWQAYRVDFANGPTSVFSMTGNSTTRLSKLTVGAGGLVLDGNTLTLNNGTAAGAFGSEIILTGGVTATGTNNFSFNGSGPGVAQVRLQAESTWDVASGTTFVNTPLVGAGSLVKTGAGVLQLQGAGANTLAGPVTVSGGSLILSKTAGINAIAGEVTVATGGTLDWNVANQLADTVHIRLTGGALKFDGLNETFAALTQTAGTVNAGGGSNGGQVTVTGLLRVSGGSTVNLNSTAVWSVGAADFTGFSGTAIALNGNSTAGLNQFIVGSGGLKLSGQGISLNKGTAAGAFGSELLLNGDLTASGTNSVNFGNTVGVARINLGAEDRIWTITSGTTTSNVEIMSLGGGLTKAGAGTLVLNGLNNHSGDTRILAGTLRLGANASLAQSPVIRVAAGATYDVSAQSGYTVQAFQTLAGGGSVTGSVTIEDGALLAPGSADAPLQQLTLSGALTLAPGSQLVLQLGAAGSADRVQVGGVFTQAQGGRIVVQAADWTPVNGLQFELIDWNSLGALSPDLGEELRDGAADDAFDLDLPSLAGTGLLWDISQFAGSGVIRVVPEPSRALLALFGGVLFLARRRR